MYCHIGTLFQFNVYSYPFLTSLTFYHVHTMFYMGRLKSWRWNYYLGRGHPFPFFTPAGFWGFRVRLWCISSSSCYGTCTPLRTRRVIWYQTKAYRVISPFPAFTFKNVFSCRLTFDTFYNFFHLLRCFFELEKKPLNFKRFQTPKRLRCGG